MRNLIENRLQAVIVIAIGVLAAMMVVLQFTKPSDVTPVTDTPAASAAPASGTPSKAPPKKGSIGSLVTGAPGSDSAAQQILRTGAIALESYFAERGSFDGAVSALAGIEPNITWTSGAAQAAANQVAVATTADGYTLTTTSASGATYSYARDGSAHIVRSCGAGCSW